MFPFRSEVNPYHAVAVGMHGGETYAGSDGRVRTLTANGRKEKVNGRDVQTKWDQHRPVSEISIGDAKVIETYERSTNAPQLISVRPACDTVRTRTISGNS